MTNSGRDPVVDVEPNRRDVLKATGGGILGLTGVSSSGAGAVQPSTDALSVTLVPADSDAGFNYPYYLYAPEAGRPDERPILVEPNNTGTATDDFEEHRNSAQGLVQHGFCRRLSDELRLPLLVPVFPRPRSMPVDYRHYVHALDAETMDIEGGKLARVDEQLRSMIRHAQEKLAEMSFPCNDSVLMNGFSASGNFVNRFTALHPDIVDSVSAGGINGTAILPRSTAKGYTLEYPIGTANLESLVGHEFDLESWRDVDQFVYMGSEDENDTIPYNDAWSQEHREIALGVYGEHMQEERMPYCRSVYENVDASARFEVYPGIGHRPAPGIQDDIITFHKRNAGLFFTEFSERPTIGDDSVRVVAGTGTRIDAAPFDVRVFDEDGSELTESAISMDAGSSVEQSASLSSSLDVAEFVTVALLESGVSDLGQAITSETVTVAGDVQFAEGLQAGDTTARVDFTLSETYAADERPGIVFETEQGGAVVVNRIDSGDDGTRTVEFDEIDLGVPLEQNRRVSVSIVDGRPVEGTVLATDTATVEEPSSIALELDVEADRVVERGEDASVEMSVRGLGGSADSLVADIDVNDERIDTESFSISSNEQKSMQIPLATEGIEEDEITVAVSVADATSETEIILADEPSVGDGSSERPYEIANGTELAYVDLERDAHFELVDDIDLSGFERFTRIGELSDEFSGTFDGRSHAIRNLRIDESLELFEGVGLFGNVNGGTIRNVHLVNVDVTGQGFVGGVVGMASSHGEISCVSVSGRINGERNVGGIIGGTSTGASRERDVVISETASYASVRGETKVAGIIGQSSGDPIEKSYARGIVSGSVAVAGILGRSDFGGVVTESYASATLEGTGGGIVASNADGSVSDAYWDIEATGESGSSGGKGLTTAEMTGEDAVENLTGFDFENTWQTVSGDYPELRTVSPPDPTFASVNILDPSDRIDVPNDEPVHVTAEVTKIGEREDGSVITLTTPDQQFETRVDIDSGETETVDFTIPAENVSGEFVITVASDSDSDSITVVAREEGSQSSTVPDGTVETTSNGTTATASTETTDLPDEGTDGSAAETTDSETTLPTTQRTGREETDGSVAGLGIVETLASLGGISYLLQRRLGDEEQ